MQPNRNDNESTRNLIIAVALSAAVLFGWQYFVAGPELERQREEQLAAAERAAAEGAGEAGAITPEAGGAVPGLVGTPSGRLTRAEAIAAGGERVAIRSERIDGSILLTGGRIDDVKLLSYRETLEPGSPVITLFSPREAPEPYFAEFGFTAAPEAGLALPGRDTLWRVVGPARTLTPESPLTLEWDNGQGLIFRRTVTLDRHYMFEIRDRVENRGSAPVTLNPYGIVARHGQPVLTNMWILHEGMIGVLEGTLKELDYSEIDEARSVGYATTGGWLGITDKYWMAALAPDASAPFQGTFRASSADGRPVYQTDVLLAPETIAPGAIVEVKQRLFAGAKAVELLDTYADRLGIERFSMAVDWGWFFFLTYPIFYALHYIHAVFGNYGVAIILLTLAIKLVFYPMANTSYRMMTKMKKLQPQMEKLRERFQDDKQKMQQELMALYQREKVNPLTGCLPILIQIPVFFSLYKVLYVTLEMRHAPFFGWIQDLSAPDPTSLFNLFGLLPFEVPSFLLLGIWPLLMGVTMWVQYKLNPEPTDPMQKQIFAWMPLIFTFLLATFPAGLVIYWTFNNLFSVIQQYVIMRRMGVDVDFTRMGPPDWLLHRVGLKRRPDDDAGAPRSDG